MSGLRLACSSPAAVELLPPASASVFTTSNHTAISAFSSPPRLLSSSRPLSYGSGQSIWMPLSELAAPPRARDAGRRPRLHTSPATRSLHSFRGGSNNTVARSKLASNFAQPPRPSGMTPITGTTSLRRPTPMGMSGAGPLHPLTAALLTPRLPCRPSPPPLLAGRGLLPPSTIPVDVKMTLLMAVLESAAVVPRGTFPFPRLEILRS
jgi:hypothetical protein